LKIFIVLINLHFILSQWTDSPVHEGVVANHRFRGYPMFRQYLASLLTTIALVSFVAQAPAQAPPATTAPAPPTSAAKATVTSHFNVYFRRTGETKWSYKGVFTDLAKARTAAADLYKEGADVKLITTATYLHARPTGPGTPAPSYKTGGEVVTFEQARYLFSVMANRTDIAYRYPADGCYARAHLMAKHMQSLGYKPAKVWAFSHSKEEPLYAKTSNHPRGYVAWSWHVAPVVQVRETSGKSRWYVIDPSLFHEPVTTVKWKFAMVRPGAKGYPHVTVAKLGHAPVDKLGRRYPGTGYRPTTDPAQGIDGHAFATMRKYKPHQGKWELKEKTTNPGHTALVALPKPKLKKNPGLARLPKPKKKEIPGSGVREPVGLLVK
jgi:hypothetical protein